MADGDEYTTRPSGVVKGLNDVSEPLRGVVICCTSVPDEKRTELAAFATQMGATHMYDLTPNVTHLIVGDFNTPKYKFVARERPDVQPMTIAWIEAVRELWMNDRPIDFDTLELEHKLPTFQSLKFSMTGCDDPAERLEIAEQVKANGAVYEGDLTRAITHLISFRIDGAKYKAAKLWGLKIVSVEWMRDSLERGMILDEALYDPTLPINERGKGAWDRTKPRRTSLGKRRREASDPIEGGKRKLRRTASTKLNSQGDGIWGDIVGGNMVAQVERSGIWEAKESAPLRDSIQVQSKNTTQNNTSSLQPTLENPPPRKDIFSGCRFYLHGFDAKKKDILHNHLVSHDAEIASNVEDLFSYLESNPIRLFRVVSHDLPMSSYPALPASKRTVTTITVWWVERCLHHKRFQEPDEHVIGQPFPIFPIKEFTDNKMSISSSAFTGIDLLHFRNAVQLIGATYSEVMTPNSSVLVTKSLTGMRKDKLEHAQEWKVPIVTADWLWDSISASKKLPFSKYRYRPQKRSDSMSSVQAPQSKALIELTRSKSVVLPIDKPSRESFENAPKPIDRTRPPPILDRTAFETDIPTIKAEEMSRPNSPLPEVSTSFNSNLSRKSEPLTEINPNSPNKTVSTAPAPSHHPAPPPPPPDLSNEISNLLSKAKATSSNTHHKDAPETRKRTNRILGRATSGSNVSIASSTHSLSRATSVDSLATSNPSVEYPASLKMQASNERMEMLLRNDDRNRVDNEESQPSMTQLQYLDTDALEARELVLARMMGDSVEGERRRKGLKERAVTLGDLMGTVGGGKRTTRRGAGGAGVGGKGNVR